MMVQVWSFLTLKVFSLTLLFPVTGSTQQRICCFGTFPFNLHCVTVKETPVNPSLANFRSAMFKIPVQ